MPNTTIPRVKSNDAGQGLMQQTKTYYYSPKGGPHVDNSVGGTGVSQQVTTQYYLEKEHNYDKGSQDELC